MNHRFESKCQKKINIDYFLTISQDSKYIMNNKVLLKGTYILYRQEILQAFPCKYSGLLDSFPLGDGTNQSEEATLFHLVASKRLFHKIV